MFDIGYSIPLYSVFSLSDTFFLLVHPPTTAYNLYGVDFPIFEPDVKAPRPARVLRVTDGDGVLAAVDRERMKGEL